MTDEKPTDPAPAESPKEEPKAEWLPPLGYCPPSLVKGADNHRLQMQAVAAKRVRKAVFEAVRPAGLRPQNRKP